MVLEDIVIQTTTQRSETAEDAQGKSNMLEMLKQQHSTYDEIIPFTLFMEALQLIKKPEVKYCSNCKRNEIPAPNPELLLRCRLCNAAQYCCATHERKDWSEHKNVCAAVREIRAKMKCVNSSMKQFLSCKCVLTLPSGRTVIICEGDEQDENEKITEMELLIAEPFYGDTKLCSLQYVEEWKSCQYLIEGDEIAVPGNTVTIMLNYHPLNQPEWFKYTIIEEKGRIPSKIVGFTNEDVVALIGMTYELIFMIEDVMTKEIKCGQYGMLGHHIGDLRIEEINVGDKYVEVSIGQMRTWRYQV